MAKVAGTELGDEWGIHEEVGVLCVPDTWTPERVTRLALNLYDTARLLGPHFYLKTWLEQFSASYRTWTHNLIEARRVGVQVKTRSVKLGQEGRTTEVSFPSKQYMLDIVDELIGPDDLDDDDEDPYDTKRGRWNVKRKIARLQKRRQKERGVA